MRYEAVSFNLGGSGIAFQSVEVYDTPKVMTVRARNIPPSIMEVVNETLRDLDVDRLELYTPRGKKNIVIPNVYIQSVEIDGEELVLEVIK